MAVADPVLYNNYWVYMRDMIHPPWGSVHLNPSDLQTHNAYRMRAALQLQGYDDYAIAGIIGNAQVESGITTGAIEKYSILPMGGESITECTNAYMLQYYTKPQGVGGYGLGLLQWDRYSTTYQSHDLLGWCNANGYIWYDGDGQMARLDFEFQHDAQYHFWVQNYNMSWADFKQIHTTHPTYDPGECANVWASCWELSSLSPEGRQQRRDNAQYWFDWFEAHPIEPGTGLPGWLYSSFNRRKIIHNIRTL